MRKMNRILAVLSALALLIALPVTALAHDVPDWDRPGSITVELAVDGDPVPWASLTLYRVCEIWADDGSFRFRPTGDFAGWEGDIEDFEDPDLAQDLAAYAAQVGAEGLTADLGEDGCHVFEDLELGLWLVTQRKAGKGYSLAEPFLVSLPQTSLQRYVYDVIATPKLSLEKLPEGTTPTTRPVLPQTGVTNWPIPTLAALGLFLLGFGWILRTGKHRETK